MKHALLILMVFTATFVACSPMPALGNSQIVVEWTTGSEVSTAGFNLYRSESRDGQYVKVNSALIPASPDPLAGGKYRYTDSDVAAGKTYYYELEDIEYGGASTRHGPIVATAAGSFGWETGLLSGGALVLIGLIVGLAIFRLRKVRLGN